jgi:hypothetical protein
MTITEAPTTRPDLDFDVPGLTWLPWVGLNYSNRPADQRLLLIGESHYYKKGENERLEYLNDRNSTRDIVAENGYDTSTFRSIPGLFFREAQTAPLFWKEIAYYNFVQRPMDRTDGAREQPNDNDWTHGWQVFLSLIKILKPSHCLFIGVSAAKHFDQGMTQNGLPFEGIRRDVPISGVCPRVAKLWGASPDSLTKIVFVHHLARIKPSDFDHWRFYLEDKHADLSKCLIKHLEGTNQASARC